MSNPLNITTAAFGGLREVTTSPLWQWDYGQILKITGLDLPQAFEVHFSNSRKSGETITQIGTNGAVTIPDMYLTSGADIYAFIFLHDGLTDGETEYVIKIPVRERPEPSDIEPTPEQQDAITEAIAALNVAVTQTAADVISADASATAAAQSATNAQAAAQSAQGSATSASASATTASNAAQTATTKAEEAATSEASAASAKTAAETAEANAQAAQAAAQSAAQTATAKASEASVSATSASGSASAASASASQASESATSAANSATAASESATSAATSASTASTKASEASASAIAAQTAQTAAEAAQTAAETAQTEAEAARDETVTEAASIRGLLKDKADIIISNADGAIATFEDGGDDMPMVSCVAKIEPVQSGSGDPSPENVRPISGWTGCNVRRTGKNLLDAQAIVTSSGHPNNCYISDGYLLFRTGNPSAYGLKWDSLKIPCPATFTITAKNFGANANIVKLTATLSDGTTDTFYNASLNQNEEATQTKTVGTAGKSIVGIYSNWTSGIVAGINLSASQIELGSTATEYEPFVGHTYPISWQSEAGTVYGGTVDVVSGVLTVDRWFDEITGCVNVGTASTGMSYSITSLSKQCRSPESSHNAISDKYKIRADAPSDSGWFRILNQSIYIFDSRFIDKATANGILATEKPKFVYKLATPKTYQLTPTEVRTLLGLNNVWADTGDVEVQYRADTKLYIDGKKTDFSKLIAPTEAAYTATRAYTSGSLLIVGNQLYKATTSIANGATLTVGTNITATTLAEVIAAL